MKYYSVKINNQFANTSLYKEYKRYKRSEGFTRLKELCWKFSKQSALKIIERLKVRYQQNPYIEFMIEEAGE